MQCIIKEREINLVIDAKSVIKDKVQLWMPIELDYHALGKRMACTPFLPVDMALGEDITLRIYIHEDIPYIVQVIWIYIYIYTKDYMITGDTLRQSKYKAKEIILTCE